MVLGGIALFIFVGTLMLVAVVGVTMSVVFLLVLSRFDEMRRRAPTSRALFVHKLVRAVSRRTLHDVADVHRSYRRFFGTGVLRGSHLEELDEFLQGALRQIRLPRPGRSENGQQEKIELLRDLLVANQRALEVEHMCAPFSGTPEFERGVLADLLTLSPDDKAAARTKLSTLARAIRFRQDTLERLRHESDRSLQLARWGWYGTLAVSILLTLLGFLCLGM